MIVDSIWVIVYMIAMFTITQVATWWVENGEDVEMRWMLRRTERRRWREILHATC